jgi:ADP-heptose:LPS heptosyltransferase
LKIPKNILVIRLSAMGDVAMAVPILKKLSDEGNVRITMLTRKAFVPLFATMENVSVFSPDLDRRHKGFIGIYRLFRDLKKLTKWDVVVDLHDVLRTKLLRTLFRFSGIKVAIINKNRKLKKQLTRQKNKVFAQIPPVQDEYANTFRKAGFPVEVLPCQLYSHNENLPEELHKITGTKTGVWIGIAPFARHTAKTYPIEQMEKIVAHFSAKSNVRIFLFGGGKAEMEQLEKWSLHCPNVISLAGKLFFENELRIMAHLDCMVSMDSGNMHLANLVNTPVVSIWGATHPFAGFLSKGNKNNKIIQLPLDCRPCSVYGNKPCYKGTNECMTGITPEMVIAPIEQILKANNQ